MRYPALGRFRLGSETLPAVGPNGHFWAVTGCSIQRPADDHCHTPFSEAPGARRDDGGEEISLPV